MHCAILQTICAEDWIVVLDSDMILRRPFLPGDFNLSRGWAVGAKYDYMIGAAVAAVAAM
jgi:hypothetical protein